MDDILPIEKIPFMHWGIITRLNFSNIKNVPIKRWDPLSSSGIQLTELGYIITLLKQYGHYSYISPIRSKRKNQYPLLKSKSDANHEFIDSFKAILDGKHYFDSGGYEIGDPYSITINDDTVRLDDPFSSNPRIRKTKGKAITFINKYPAMCRVIDPEIKEYIEKHIDQNAKIAMGINLISTTRKYYERLEDADLESLVSLFKSIIDGIKHVIKKANEQGIYYIPVSPFFNFGDKAGGSVPRIHGQVYIDLNEDGHGSRLENILKSFEKMKKNNH
ncbi:MAG: hypothetical protein ACTSRA_06120, partial [Promethearchaeota archaeon]